MNFRLKSKPKRVYEPRNILAGIVFVILLFLAYFFPNFSSNLGNNVVKPFWYIKDKSSIGVYYITDFFKFKNSLIKEKNKLEDEVNKLRLTKIDYDLLVKENDELKSQFGRMDKKDRILANVISKPPQSPYDTFIIDAGSSVGVTLGKKVYLSDNIILGVISKVNQDTSVVSLYSTSGEKIESVNSRTGTTFVIEGKGGENFSVTVPKETDIIWGDSFLLPNTNLSLLGMVNFVDSNSQSSFKDIHIRIPGNAFQSKYVFIDK